MGLPTSQKAAVKQGEGKASTAPVQNVPVHEPGPGQILVKINWTGLCGSDKSLVFDEWESQGLKMLPQTNGIAGHEGAGEVVAVHDDVKDLWNVGDRAGVKWVASVCKKCEFCTNGTDVLQCPKQLNSGFSIQGTFAEYCLTDARYATRLPEGVSDEEAGPILCGGVTAYTACKRSAVRPGQWIVLPGAGGGLGHLAVQYARAMGMRIIAVDGGDEKGKLCKQLGAEHYIDFLACKDVAAEVMKLTTYGAHGVIVFAATREAYGSAPNFLRPGGTVVAVGLPKDETIIAGASPLTLVLKRLNIVGSVTGTLKEVEEALDFTARGLVRPILTKGTLEDVDRFLQLLEQGKLPGRAVLKVAA
ncbi:alcohol dehydrogenase, partial [Aureobasidium melanogenum]